MKLCVGVLTAELQIPGSHSLKERRSVVNSIKERVKRRCNVSITEAPGELWQRADLAFSCAGATESQVESQLRAVRELLDQEPRLVLIQSGIEYYV